MKRVDLWKLRIDRDTIISEKYKENFDVSSEGPSTCLAINAQLSYYCMDLPTLAQAVQD
jgi:hypothetical protein